MSTNEAMKVKCNSGYLDINNWEWSFWCATRLTHPQSDNTKNESIEVRKQLRHLKLLYQMAFCLYIHSNGTYFIVSITLNNK